MPGSSFQALLMSTVASSTPAASVVYVGATNNTTNGTTSTFTTHAIGTAATGRRVVVLVHARGATSTNAIPTGVTLGGNAMTLVTSADNHNLGDGACSMWIRQEDTGTTGTIVATFTGGTVANAAVSVYAVYDLLSSTATGTATHGAAQSNAMPIDCSAGGVIIGGAWVGNNVTATWVNITEDNDANIEATNSYRTAASLAFASAQTALSVECNYSGATTQNACLAASFR